MSRLMRKDLFENRWIKKCEEHSNEPFESKRTKHLFERQGKNLTKSKKQSVMQYEIFNRIGLDTFPYESKLYYEDLSKN